MIIAANRVPDTAELWSKRVHAHHPPASSFFLRARTLDGASTARSISIFPWLIVDGARPDGLKAPRTSHHPRRRRFSHSSEHELVACPSRKLELRTLLGVICLPLACTVFSVCQFSGREHAKEHKVPLILVADWKRLSFAAACVSRLVQGHCL